MKSESLRFLAVLMIWMILNVVAQTNKMFSAKFRIEEDPNIEGIITGTIYYNANTKAVRSDLNVGAIEVFNYTKAGEYVRYLGCYAGTVCNAETWRFDMPIYYVEPADTQVQYNTSLDGRNCTGYKKVLSPIQVVADNQVQYLFVDHQDNDKPCRAVFGNGRYISFVNVSAIDPSVNINIQQTWQCPAQTCSKLIDIILIFDESGSINSDAFQKEKDFAISFAKAFKFGPNDVALELIMFANSATRIMPLSVDQSGVLAYIQGVTQSRGSTCIGCGIAQAQSDFEAYGRSLAAKVAVVLTDGQNNVKVHTFVDTVNSAKDAGITFFSIGVDDFNRSELIFISSDIPGIQTFFETPDFNSLSSILNSFIASTCIEIPGNPCGTGCRGYCCCNKECRCPDTCDDYDKCTTDRCNNGTSGNGCTYSRITCNDGDACTVDGCNPSSGCFTDPVNCDDNDPCTDNFCDSILGCQHKPRSCDDSDPCTYDYCLSNTTMGCQHDPIDCGNCSYVAFNNKTCAQIKCALTECDPSSGNCTSKNITCNDNNACSNDYCSSYNGECQFDPIVCNDHNACTVDACDAILGCTFTPLNLSVCDDGSVCTNDTCDITLGCLNTPIICDDQNNCTVDDCNSILGCTFLPKDCSLEITASKCTSSACNVVSGCYLQPIDTLIQSCGKCVGDGPCDQIATIAGISGGVIAAIVIGASVAAAAVAGVSGRAGYKAYLRNKNTMTGAQMSPLYTDNGMSGTNPFFDGTTGSATPSATNV